MGIVILIFGASGDLAEKKIYPALYKLYLEKYLSLDAKIVGYGRTQMSNEDLRLKLHENLERINNEHVEGFLELCVYVSGQYDESEGYIKIKKEFFSNCKIGIFYLALPPIVFDKVALMIKKHLWHHDDDNADNNKKKTLSPINRLVIEKPFGHDLKSFKSLHANLSRLFKESEIYRIDHYLGKEMIKNIYFLRFSNLVFSELWSGKFISTIQIVFKEPFGVKGRAGYFDDNGIVRDVFQNHLLQLVSIIGMEKPSFSSSSSSSSSLDSGSESIRDAKVKFLNSIKTIDPDNVIYGQYKGYREDVERPQSNTCTFAMITLRVNEDDSGNDSSKRWSGVPFILRGGKALNEHKTEIRIQFKPTTCPDLCFPAIKGSEYQQNELVIRIQPEEAIYLKINIKRPGFEQKTLVSELDLTYSCRYENLNIPEAYQSLLLDAIKGDQGNFVRDDELEAAWRIIDPILNPSSPSPSSSNNNDNNNNNIKVHLYEKGSRGPGVINQALSRLGCRRPDENNDYAWPKQIL